MPNDASPSVRRAGRVHLRGQPVGVVIEYEATPDGRFCFQYDAVYLAAADAQAISLTFPLRPEPYFTSHLHGYFAGLLTEGRFAVSQCRQLKIDEADLFGRVLATCHTDTIGAVTVTAIDDLEGLQP